MSDTTIEWTDKTWNPTVGCTRVSPGCKNCYAFALHDMRHKAYTAGKKLPAQYAKPFTTLQMIEDRLDEPLHWRKQPCRVFVNSVSDLFHEDVPAEFIRKVFGVMSTAGQHTFQVLTKRAERMMEWFAINSLSDCQAEYVAGNCSGLQTPTGRSRIRDDRSINGSGGNRWPLPNVWLGVSVEDQPRADERTPLLLKTPAAVRFLSCEPLLGPIDFFYGPNDWGLLTGIDWVIVGGESGPDARPCDVTWIRSIVEQCKAAGVPCFVKQLGSAPYIDHSPEPAASIIRLRDRKGGEPSEWSADLRVREFPHESAHR